MPKSTLDSPAWKVLSDGAQRLYIALKARTDNKHHTAYLSTRDAAKALGRSHDGGRKIREWFGELQHYGFIVMLSEGCLGVDGKGKAPHWRLTDKGTVRGRYEEATQDFLRWNGVLFDSSPYRPRRRRWWEGKIESRVTRARQGAEHVPDSPAEHVPTPNGASAEHVPDIGNRLGAVHVPDITSLTTSGALADPQNDPRLTTDYWRKHGKGH